MASPGWEPRAGRFRLTDAGAARKPLCAKIVSRSAAAGRQNRGYVEPFLRDRDPRITREGVLVIKSQQHRSLERNREEALARLHELVARAAVVPRQRRPTRPTRSSQKKRLEGKTRRGEVKKLRGRVRSAAD